MIYAAIGRLVVENCGPKHLSHLRDTQERFRAATNAHDAPAMVLEDHRFHEVIGGMSGNTYLQTSLGRLLIDHARIGSTFFRPQDAEMRRHLTMATRQHDDFIAAIAAHDETAMVEIIFDHWELSREEMERSITPHGLKTDAFINSSTS